MRASARVICVISILGVFIVSLTPSVSQERSAELSAYIEQELRGEIAALQATVDRQRQALKMASDDVMAAAIATDTDAVEAMRAQNSYAIAKFKHLSWLDQNAQRIFVWQNIALWAVSAITVVMALMAIIVALFGLKSSLRVLGTKSELESEIDTLIATVGGDDQKSDAAKAQLLTKFTGAASDFEISLTGIRVTSAATWVIVLLIAFAYLYLFVTEVMDMKEVNFGAPTLSSQSQAGSSSAGSGVAPSTTPNSGCQGESCDPPGQ